ncbi:MAG: hypothetical protein JSU72_12675 [Deltaproteobacteria bacterium]|nr:MAG: hypothetical protein JSU72_12675 [Deltaproteobacteria bacterium]
MKSCPDHRETLLLDVYGELAADDRPAWEKHLETCDTCRLERRRLTQLLRLTREAIPSPDLSPEEAKALQSAISRRLRKETGKAQWRTRFLGITARPIPALVAASLLVVILGWFGLRQFQAPPPLRTASSLDLEEEMIAQDRDIIENLELLEQMDVLEKVVHVVDQRDVRL